MITPLSNRRLLVHLASGIGNIVLATPLLLALKELGAALEIALDADYAASADLFQCWSVVDRVHPHLTAELLHGYDRVVPAVPPFYWWRFANLYRGCGQVVPRPADSLFYRDEQEYYMAFARRLGYTAPERPFYSLPISPSADLDVGASTVALVPGCKTGEMAAKRWPYFVDLAARLPEVVVVGTGDDLPARPFPPHVRVFVDRLTLRQTGQLLAGVGLVVGNDSGLSHLAGAVGTPTLMLFGPTSERVLGRLPNHVRVLRAGLPCEPCWTTARLRACQQRVDCLRALSVEAVLRVIEETLPAASLPGAVCAAQMKSGPCE